MITLNKEHYIRYFSSDNLPAAHCQPGEKICFHLWEGFSGGLVDGTHLFHILKPDQITRVTGPLFIETAKPGDILKVCIEEIELDNRGTMITVPKRGGFREHIREERTKIIQIRRGYAIFREDLLLPLRPMIGVIGTAPAEGSLRAGIPAEHGANMDCPCIQKGSVVYLPVFTPGALLALGDLHALQGDGEVVLCGLETGGRVILRTQVIPDAQSKIPTPLVVHDGKINLIGIGDDLTQAAYSALSKILAITMDFLNMDETEAGMLLSLVCDLHVCQLVNERMTMYAQVPLSILYRSGKCLP